MSLTTLLTALDHYETLIYPDTLAGGRDLLALAAQTPLSRDEYEAMCGNAHHLNPDATIWRHSGGWWQGGDRPLLLWALAHLGRHAALVQQYGMYRRQPLPWLEYVDGDGLPDGFPAWQQTQEA